MSKNNNAQIWFTDFVIGTLIFTFMLIVYYTYTTNISKQDSLTASDMIADLESVSTSLLLSGFPDNWDNTTVQIIGITNNNQRINESKLRNFRDLPYKKAKKILGTIYDFAIFFEDDKGNLVNLGTECSYSNGSVSINKSYKLAGYFDKGDNEMQGKVTELEQKLGVSIYNGWSNINDMLNNISAYDFVLIEKPELSLAQVSQLESYVASKGIIFISNELLNQDSGTILGVNYQKGDECKNTTIVHKDLFLSFNPGDVIEPNNCPYISGDVTTIGQFPNGTISIAKWNYGNGRVFYFSDFNAKFLDEKEKFQERVKDAIESSILVCGKTNNIGLGNINYKSLVKTERFVIFDSKTAKMVLYLWN
jgi:hypothetical protein